MKSMFFGKGSKISLTAALALLWLAFASSPLFAKPDFACPEADLTGDGHVNAADETLFDIFMGTTDHPQEVPGDFDIDGDVDVNDEMIFDQQLATTDGMWFSILSSPSTLPENNAVIGSNWWEHYDPTDNFMAPASFATSGRHFSLGDASPALTDSELYNDTMGNVALHNGTFIYRNKVIDIPTGGGLNFRFILSYNSRGSSSCWTQLGQGWDANVFARCERLWQGGWFLYNGFNEFKMFVEDPNHPGYYNGTDGLYSILREEETTLTIRNRYGMISIFEIVAGSDMARLKYVQDRAQNPLNRLEYVYDPGDPWRLIQVKDIYSTETTNTFDFAYNTENHLQTITDTRNGRVWTFGQSNFQLNSITTPAVSTTTGNDFPNGKTTKFSYYEGEDGWKMGKLIAITNPNEVAQTPTNPVPYMVMDYYGEAEDISHGLVKSITTGGANYHTTVPTAAINYKYCTHRTEVTDRMGNRTVYHILSNGNIWKVSEFTPAPNNFFISSELDYNADREIISTENPLGGLTQLNYQNNSNPNLLRYSDGNLLSKTMLPYVASEQSSLVWTYSYENVFNQLKTLTDPKNNTWNYFQQYQELSQNAASNALEGELLFELSSTAILNLFPPMAQHPGFDLNGFAETVITGNTVAMLHPSAKSGPMPADAAHKSGVSYSFNEYNQLILSVDEEQNVHEFKYYPLNSPHQGMAEGVGGYLKQSIRDSSTNSPRNVTFFEDNFYGRNSGHNPLRQSVKNDFVYNLQGIPVSTTDPRGVLTFFEVNELDQIVLVNRADSVNPAGRGGGIDNMNETTSGTVFQPLNYASLNFYDYNDNLIATFTEIANANTVDQSAGSGALFNALLGISLPSGSGWAENYTAYDILDNARLSRRELDTSNAMSANWKISIGSQNYDANERLSLSVLPEGNQILNSYERRDLLLSTTRGFGSPEASTTTNVYDFNRNLVEFRDAEDNDGTPGMGDSDLTLYFYDGFDRLKRTVSPVGTETINSYDPNSNVTNIQVKGKERGTSPVDNDTSANVLLQETDFVYDARNRQTTSTEQLFLAVGALPNRAPVLGVDVVTTTTYDRMSRVIWVTEHDGDEDESRYDGLSRLLEKIDTTCDCANSVLFKYDDNGNLVERVETDKPSAGAGFPAPAPEFRFFVNDYDALNRLICSIDPIGNSPCHQYDSRNIMTATADAQGPAGSVSYKSTTGVFYSVNDLGNVTNYFHDSAGRLLKSESILTVNGHGNGTFAPLPDNSQGGGDGIIRISQSWDLNSRLKTQVDDGGNTTTYLYDMLDRLTQTNFADGLSEILVYDKDSNVKNRTDQNGSVFTFTYDPANRRILASVVPGAGVLNYSTQQVWQYDGLSRLTFSRDNNRNISDPADDEVCNYFYNSRSQLLEEQQDWDFMTNKAISGTYVDETDRTQLAYPKDVAGPDTAPRADFGYDIRDRVNDINWRGQNAALWDFMAYRPLQITFGNGTKTRWHNGAGIIDGYDDDRRITKQQHLSPGNLDIQTFTYQYDRMDNRTLETASFSSGPSSDIYTYDSAYRLRTVSGLHNHSWDLDGQGNWTGFDGGPDNTANNMNEYTNFEGLAQSHDDNGNLLADGTGKLFKYDAWNRLRDVSQGKKIMLALYDYDAGGRRVLRRTPQKKGEYTFYYYDGVEVIEERDNTNLPLRRYVCGRGIDQPVLMEDAGNLEKYYYHCNALGSVALLTDNAGFEVERYENDTYGNPTSFNPDFSGPGPESLFGNPYRFTSRHFDGESGLYYYRARHYHPTQGRFLQRDPIGYTPNSRLNLYAYVGNNPANRVDSLGLFDFSGFGEGAFEVSAPMPGPLAAVCKGVISFKLSQPDTKRMSNGKTHTIEDNYFKLGLSCSVKQRLKSMFGSWVDKIPGDISVQGFGGTVIKQRGDYWYIDEFSFTVSGTIGDGRMDGVNEDDSMIAIGAFLEATVLVDGDLNFKKFELTVGGNLSFYSPITSLNFSFGGSLNFLKNDVRSSTTNSAISTAPCPCGGRETMSPWRHNPWREPQR